MVVACLTTHSQIDDKDNTIYLDYLNFENSPKFQLTKT